MPPVSVSLVVPGVRMAIVAIARYERDVGVDGEFEPPGRFIIPVLAIRSIVHEEGRCQNDLMVLDPNRFVGVATVDDAYPSDHFALMTVICSWPESKDAERLGVIATQMAAMQAQKDWQAESDSKSPSGSNG